MTNTPDDLADYWAAIQESLTDALVKYKKSNPELIQSMEATPYYNTMIRNEFANGWGKLARADKTIDDVE